MSRRTDRCSLGWRQLYRSRLAWAIFEVFRSGREVLSALVRRNACGVRVLYTSWVSGTVGSGGGRS